MVNPDDYELIPASEVPKVNKRIDWDKLLDMITFDNAVRIPKDRIASSAVRKAINFRKSKGKHLGIIVAQSGEFIFIYRHSDEEKAGNKKEKFLDELVELFRRYNIIIVPDYSRGIGLDTLWYNDNTEANVDERIEMFKEGLRSFTL